MRLAEPAVQQQVAVRAQKVELQNVQVRSNHKDDSQFEPPSTARDAPTSVRGLIAPQWCASQVLTFSAGQTRIPPTRLIIMTNSY
jgi:hypothetical protein